MILHDTVLHPRYSDYGIMLPISASRSDKIIGSFAADFYKNSRGSNYPYPGPVLDFAAAKKLLGITGPAIDRQDLERVHSAEFTAQLYDRTPRGQGLSPLARALLDTYELIDAEGKPHRYEPEKAVRDISELFDNTLEQVSGTYLACRLALAEGPGFCFFLGGGMHHARRDAGAGFCLLNDIAVAAAKILSDTALCFYRKKKPRLVWVVDLDAHKGDGTAELVQRARERGELARSVRSAPDNAPCILTLSLHMARGWPLDEETLATAQTGRAPLVPSDIDTGIEEGEEAEYVPRLEAALGQLETLSSGTRPDLVIVVDGADPYEHDGLPSSAPLKLSLEQCFRRDMLVYHYVTRRGIPSAWIMAGGYGERAWEPPANFLRNLRGSIETRAGEGIAFTGCGESGGEGN
ncbi:MAG: hypothetical protein LBN92_00685 [Treponema sp.]|nr:hypothetical protein [Treponema sp.]